MRLQNTRKKLPDSEKKYSAKKERNRFANKENDHENIQMLSEEELNRKVCIYLNNYSIIG